MADIIHLDPQAGADGEVHTPAYGYYREGGARAVGLGFCLRDGREFGFPYARLAYGEFTPADLTGVEVIRLVFVGKEQVVIRGRNLEPMAEHVWQHRLLRVTETGEAADQPGREGLPWSTPSGSPW